MRALLIIGLSIYTSLHGQTYSKMITDEEIGAFMKWEMEKDTAKKLRHVSRKIIDVNSDIFKAPDSAELNHPYAGPMRRKHPTAGMVFKKEEIDYFIQQIKKQKKRYWLLNTPRIVLTDSSSFHPAYTTFSYSLPYFSPDRQTVMIVEGFYCGLVCGGGAIYVYRKKNVAEWEFVTKTNEWSE